MKRLLFVISCQMLAVACFATVIVKAKSPQAEYAASILQGIPGKIVIEQKELNCGVKELKELRHEPALSLSKCQQPESFSISRKGSKVIITGADGNGCIYGANKLKEYYLLNGNIKLQKTISEAPGMKIRGTCLGLQKTVYLPGHKVYEYPYTPENFPWFYDKQLWIRYLDMLAASNFNTVFLWNGHPFASLVKLKDYPFAPEVDDATMAKNQEIFSFLTAEASKRGIMVVQMFYNIIVSKPFADHYGIKTQDRNRPITPLISDYTRKSISAFIEKYPNVGLLICLGEAMNGIDTDIKWMTETIIPGIRDGLKASNRTDEPPIILRSHDTDGPKVLAASLPLYKNIYTMSKYTGESLTTYEPRGPWAETHRQLAAAAPVHISNVHILANLEPWRWSSPAFVQKTVKAMHEVHHANGLHLYPQSSYWDWPYSADKISSQSQNGRLLQIDRDWMWYSAWGRYSWKKETPEASSEETSYWKKVLADYYGCSEQSASKILSAYNESGEIAPKLIRRFGITEGNRQTLLLGMKMTELVNPYKYTIYPGFYESCGPEGEKLIEYVEKEWKHSAHTGELPLDIVSQCVEHGSKASDFIQAVLADVTKNKEEFLRLVNDITCYRLFAESFRYKVLAAQQVLNYKWSKDISYLEKAIPLLEQSNAKWKDLVKATKETYLYANSMQTSQRRIPVGGDNGKFKTWEEMLPVYEGELVNLKKNIAKLTMTTDDDSDDDSDSNSDDDSKSKNRKIEKSKNPPYNLKTSKPQNLKTSTPYSLVPLKKGALLYEGRDEVVDSVAPELEGLEALVLNRDTARINGITVDFTCNEPVQMLVGFFVDDQNKFASPPKLEVDASGNEYGQAEPVITNAISITKMPNVNIHSYHFPAGHHVINLPKGIIMVAGFTSTNLAPRDAMIGGGSDEVDWLFL